MSVLSSYMNWWSWLSNIKCSSVLDQKTCCSFLTTTWTPSEGSYRTLLWLWTRSMRHTGGSSRYSSYNYIRLLNSGLYQNWVSDKRRYVFSRYIPVVSQFCLTHLVCPVSGLLVSVRGWIPASETNPAHIFWRLPHSSESWASYNSFIFLHKTFITFYWFISFIF